MRDLARLQEEFAELAPGDILRRIEAIFPGEITLATALNPEDQVLTHLLSRNAPTASIFMVDTGRLFQETHDLLEETRQRYGLHIEVLIPEADALESMVNCHGANLFRKDRAGRRHCCEIRKLAPLRRALDGKQAWITGLRREQSPTRQEVKAIEWDEQHGLYKVNPLWNWHHKQVWDFIANRGVPISSLHDMGYTSLGCAPCTRAVKPGESWRGGRWWWEDQPGDESGLHSYRAPQALEV